MRDRLVAWLERWYPPLATGGVFAFFAWVGGAPSWAIWFAWFGGMFVAHLEQRSSKFEEEWQQEREWQENRWERLGEWLEKNLQSPESAEPGLTDVLKSVPSRTDRPA